jgi:hypothetical protein
MKKLIASILALILVLSLCACDNDDSAQTAEDTNIGTTTQTQGGNDPTTEPSEPSEPTAEEWDILETYCQCVCFLEDPYGHGAEASIYVSETNENLRGIKAFQYACKKLMEMDLSVVEKYKDTPYMDELENLGSLEITRDYKKVLARISTVEDVLLTQAGTAKDRLDNSFDIQCGRWEYDKNGNVCNAYQGDTLSKILHMDALDPVFLLDYADHYTPEYIYGADGRLEKTRMISKYGTADYVITPAYDATGMKVKDVEMDNYGGQREIRYTYDNEGRLVNANWAVTEYLSYSITYTYDGNGNVTDVDIWEYAFRYRRYHANYVYDAKGNLVSGVYTWHEYHNEGEYIDKERVDKYTFTTDERGRVTAVDIVYSDKMRVSGSKPVVFEASPYVSASLVCTYGTYYVYIPAE